MNVFIVLDKNKQPVSIGTSEGGAWFALWQRQPQDVRRRGYRNDFPETAELRGFSLHPTDVNFVDEEETPEILEP